MKALAAVLLLLVAAPTAEISYFCYERAVQIPAGASGQACLTIDPGVFAHAAPELADVRLYRDSTETPYALRVARGVAEVKEELQPLNRGRSGGQTVFDTAMPAGTYSDIELAIAARDFIATVMVSGSQEPGGRDGTELGNFTIFDLSRQRLGRSTVLHLPQSNFRSLHFRIDGPITPDAITGVSVAAGSRSESKYVVVSESAQAAQKGRSTVIEFDVPAHTPVDRVTFIPGAQAGNFSRDITVNVRPSRPTSEDAEAQTVTMSGNLLRVHRVDEGRRIDEERLSIDANSGTFDTASKWTVRVENGDDPPLPIRSVRLKMLERALCFDAAGAQYTLYYGDPALSAPQYDYARLFAPAANPVSAVMGPEQRNPTYVPRPDDRPFTEKHPALLWAALAIVLALLALIAVRSAKLARPVS